MTLNQTKYHSIRSKLVSNYKDIIASERRYMDFLVGVTFKAATNLYADFCRAGELIPFWINYAPKQRGRKPKGTSIPWSEVGEKSLSANLLLAIWQENPQITFPGLPFGGDVRFATGDAVIHFDVKLTGPNDNPNEVVVPPQQVSGDGLKWNNGPINSPCEVIGTRAEMMFQPKLPPFYILGGKILLCLTYFLKAVYTVEKFGIQPLEYLEVACVPNGLLLFAGPKYALKSGLFIPGKDDQTKAVEDKRTRIRLDPLAAIEESWRCVKILKTKGGWEKKPRLNEV